VVVESPDWGTYFFMKYAITINQLANYEKGLGLDLADLALFDFVQSFVQSGRCECVSMDDKPFFWISPQFVIDEMPILGINTTRGINIRFENLINAGLLVRGPENKSKRKTYLAFGPRVADYEFSTWNENSKSLGTEFPSTNKVNDNNKIYYGKDGKLFSAEEAKPTNPMAEREKKFRADCMSYVGEFGTQMVDEFVLYWTEPNKSKTAMKFEIQKTWDTHRRMLTWSRNNFHKYNRQEPTAERKEMSAEEAMRLAGWIH